MHVWVCVCARACWCVFKSRLQLPPCVSLNAKQPLINTVMSLHILTTQHDSPKTHYRRFQVCLLHRQTDLLWIGLLKKHCEHIISLWRMAQLYRCFQRRGWKGKWVPTGCTWHEIWNRVSRVKWVYFINDAEKARLLFINIEDPCCEYGNLGCIISFGGSIFLSFLLYKIFSFNILSWSWCTK